MEHKPTDPVVTREARIGAALVSEALGIGDHFELEVEGSGESVDLHVHSDRSRLLERLDIISTDSPEFTA